MRIITKNELTPEHHFSKPFGFSINPKYWRITFTARARDELNMLNKVTKVILGLENNELFIGIGNHIKDSYNITVSAKKRCYILSKPLVKEIVLHLDIKQNGFCKMDFYKEIDKVKFYKLTYKPQI